MKIYPKSAMENTKHIRNLRYNILHGNKAEKTACLWKLFLVSTVEEIGK